MVLPSIRNFITDFKPRQKTGKRIIESIERGHIEFEDNVTWRHRWCEMLTEEGENAWQEMNHGEARKLKLVKKKMLEQQDVERGISRVSKRWINPRKAEGR